MSALRFRLSSSTNYKNHFLEITEANCVFYKKKLKNITF